MPFGLPRGFAPPIAGLLASAIRLAVALGRPGARFALEGPPHPLPIPPLSHRHARHLIVIAALALAAFAPGSDTPAVQPPTAPATLASDMPAVFKQYPAPDVLVAASPAIHRPEIRAPADFGREAGVGQGDMAARGNEQPSAIKGRASAPFTYVVEPGDTIEAIAEKFGITMDTVITANDLARPDMLDVGAELTILPVSGLVHTIAAGDTLVDIAAEYGVSTETIAAYNGLSDPQSLRVGARLVVPEGRLQVARLSASTRGGARVAPPGTLQWPTVGNATSYFSAGHRGVDLAAASGTPVYAAEAGTVVAARRDSYDYGYHLIVDHGNGYTTLYAHLSAFYADYGERVVRGDAIGAVGSTGLSTGPHLHFEVWENGVKVNPFNYLP